MTQFSPSQSTSGAGAPSNGQQPDRTLTRQLQGLGEALTRQLQLGYVLEHAATLEQLVSRLNLSEAARVADTNALLQQVPPEGHPYVEGTLFAMAEKILVGGRQQIVKTGNDPQRLERHLVENVDTAVGLLHHVLTINPANLKAAVHLSEAITQVACHAAREVTGAPSVVSAKNAAKNANTLFEYALRMSTTALAELGVTREVLTGQREFPEVTDEKQVGRLIWLLGNCMRMQYCLAESGPSEQRSAARADTLHFAQTAMEALGVGRAPVELFGDTPERIRGHADAISLAQKDTLRDCLAITANIQWRKGATSESIETLAMAVELAPRGHKLYTALEEARKAAASSTPVRKEKRSADTDALSVFPAPAADIPPQHNLTIRNTAKKISSNGGDVLIPVLEMFVARSLEQYRWNKTQVEGFVAEGLRRQSSWWEHGAELPGFCELAAEITLLQAQSRRRELNLPSGPIGELVDELSNIASVHLTSVEVIPATIEECLSIFSHLQKVIVK